MVKRTITITTILIILTIAVGLIIMLNKPSFGADIASGTSGTCSWIIDSEGVLTIRPTSGVSGTLAEFTLTNYTHDWQVTNLREKIKKVVIEEGVKTGQGCYNMFASLTNCTEIDLFKLDTSDATNMSGMFSSCEALTTINLSSFNTENVTNMSGMFSGCKALTTIDLSSFNTKNVTDMHLMFVSCYALTSIDVSAFNTEKVTSMSGMFSSCEALTTINLSSFNTENVTDMSGMFAYCYVLTSINISTFNTKNVTDMHGMFVSCYALTSIDVSAFNTEKVTNMSGMFANCEALTAIDLSSFNTENLIDMSGLLFSCKALTTIDLSSFNTENVMNMSGLLYNVDNLAMIKLGENFSFDGKGNISGKGILPTPVGDSFTGKWIREDKAFGPYTAEELRDNYDGSTMAGTWIRERKQFTVTYNYSGNIPQGVSELPETRIYEVGEDVIVAPDASASGYIFSGWKTQNVTITDGQFSMPNNNVILSGNFVPAGYIEYYTETKEEEKYELFNREIIKASDILELDTDSTYWIYNIDNYNYPIEGFTYDYVLEDRLTYTLKLYYKRNSYNIGYSYVGDVPNDASELPAEQSYKFEEKIELPEKAIAEGYTFSGWNTDYITMPAENIEITGYFIENDSKEYTIEYYFDGKKDDSISEIMNAKINQVVSIKPQNFLKYKNTHYMLVSEEHEIKVSENEEENVIKVYYETDVLDYTDENFNLGDGIPDKYQIKITYKVENGSWDDGTNNSKTSIVTLKDKNGNYAEDGTGELNDPQVGNKPAEGYTTGSWNREIPNKVSRNDDRKEFVYSYKTISKADISEAKGKLSNPKTDDIMQNYLLIGIGGVLVLIIVRKIRRKYSRKAKKIQF